MKHTHLVLLMPSASVPVFTGTVKSKNRPTQGEVLALPEKKALALFF